MRVLVTPAVYPRVFEVLTTLRALREKSHCVNSISDHRKKKEKKKE